jgi:hypothetical protein
MYVQRNTEARRRNHSRRGKAVTIKYSECMFVALVIQHAMRMRRVIQSSVACSGLQSPHPQPPYLFANCTIFGRRVESYCTKKCVTIFSTDFVSNISHSMGS